MFCLFGLWKIGAVPVTLSSLYGPDELGRSLGKVNAVALVSDRAGLATAASLRSPLPKAVVGSPGNMSGFADLDELAAACDAALIAPDLPGDRDAVVLFTGGTTG